MATRMVARKCPICSGALTYDKATKLWTCLYCGAVSEREFQYDGLYTVNNAVRQALKDVAKGRLDEASKHLNEAEMIDYDYVGTIVTGLAYEMIMAMTPGACTEREMRNHITAVKEKYGRLRNKGQTITEDEEALYELLEDSDVYATLLLVFDSIGDASRRDFVESLLDPEKIYTESVSTKLLSYAIKHNKFDLVDKLLNNSNNLDTKNVLGIILKRYPDGDAKCAGVQKMIKHAELGREDKVQLEDYILNSADSVHTKAQILTTLMDAGLRIDLDKIIEHVLSKADAEDQKAVITSFCKKKMSDEDVEALVKFGISSGIAETANSILDCLQKGNQFIFIPTSQILETLRNDRFSTEEKIDLVKRFYGLKTSDKAEETVFAEYLCNIKAAAEERGSVLGYLFTTIKTIPTKTVENYVLKCSFDYGAKPDVIEAMFDKGLNVSFFNDLLSRYMKNCPDQEDVRKLVIRTLVQKGLKIDADSLVDYVCYADANIGEKVEFLDKSISNGTQIRSDAANYYLEKVSDQQFSSELFSRLFKYAGSFSENAIIKYLLTFNDRQDVKAANFKAIADNSRSLLPGIRCNITHLGNNLTCNLLQAYILNTNDSTEVANQIADYMINDYKIKINEEITASGARMKLKKYIVANRSNLSQTADALFEKYKVYNMLF